MISATSGYEIKNKESNKLNSDVEKWLKAGNEIKSLNGFEGKKEIKRESFTKSEFGLGTNDVGGIMSPAMQKHRANTQQPLMAKYYKMAYKRTVWMNLIERAGVKISSTHLYAVAKGRSSIVNNEIWEAVKKAVLSLIEDIKAGRTK